MRRAIEALAVAVCLASIGPAVALAQLPRRGPSLELVARDLARGPARTPRPIALLRNEVMLLDRLVSATRGGDPSLGPMCERLMRVQLELARALRGTSPDEAGEWTRRAFALSARIAQVDPALASDERNALLHASLVAEVSGMTAARPLYQGLLLAHPTGTTPPIVYAIFGDDFMSRGDLLIAQRFYERAMSGVPPRAFVHGYCVYRLAWLDAQRGEDQQSLVGFTRVLDGIRANAGGDGASELGAAARRDLVAPYSRIGRRDRAEVFFRRFATPEETREMLAQLDSLLRENRRR